MWLWVCKHGFLWSFFHALQLVTCNSAITELLLSSCLFNQIFSIMQCDVSPIIEVIHVWALTALICFWMQTFHFFKFFSFFFLNMLLMVITASPGPKEEDPSWSCSYKSKEVNVLGRLVACQLLHLTRLDKKKEEKDCFRESFSLSEGWSCQFFWGIQLLLLEPLILPVLLWHPTFWC